MPVVRDIFGTPVAVKRRSREAPVVVKESARTRFKNPSGGGEPCPVEDRRGGGDIIERLMSLSKNKVFASPKLEREYIARRISEIREKGVLEKAEELLRQRPNYKVNQAIDVYDGFKWISMIF